MNASTQPEDQNQEQLTEFLDLFLVAGSPDAAGVLLEDLDLIEEFQSGTDLLDDHADEILNSKEKN